MFVEVGEILRADSFPAYNMLQYTLEQDKLQLNLMTFVGFVE